MKRLRRAERKRLARERKKKKKKKIGKREPLNV